MRIHIGVLALVLLSSAAMADSQWLAFRDPAGTFTADLPGTPTVAHDSVKGSDGQPIAMLEYTIDHGDSAMVVIVSDLTRFPNADSGKVIDGAVSGAKSTASQVLSDTITTLDGQAGRDVSMVDKDGNQIEDRIFFVGLRLYQVMSVVPKSPTPAQVADTQRFESTFHFTIN
jgi:hypothetical protein